MFITKGENMKTSKKILCGALAGVSLLTGMGALAGCDITKEKEPAVNYQLKMETILNNWQNELDRCWEIAPFGELINVNTREDGNDDMRAFQLFVENGVNLSDTTKFSTIGGDVSHPGSYDNTTLTYVDDITSTDLYLEDFSNFEIKDIKLNQYYRAQYEDENIYFIFTIDDEKVRLVKNEYMVNDNAGELNYHNITIRDYYYTDNTCTKIEEMSYLYEFGVWDMYGNGNLKEIDSKSWEYLSIIPTSNKELRCADGLIELYYSNHGEGLQGADMQYQIRGNMSIYSEIDGIYYNSSDYDFEDSYLKLTTQAMDKIDEIKELISLNSLTIEELSQKDCIELEYSEE